MTLILALITKDQVHMSCDFRLTDARTKRPLDVIGHKLVPVITRTFQALVGFTGIAHLGSRPLGDLIAEIADPRAVDEDAGLDGLILALNQSLSAALGRVPRSSREHRRLSVVVGAIQNGQSSINLLSNFQNLHDYFLPSDEIPSDELRLTVSHPRDPRLFAAGQSPAVRREERVLLERSCRANVDHLVIRQRIADMNSKASSRSDYVSEGCTVHTVTSIGVGGGETYRLDENAAYLPPDVARRFREHGIELMPQINSDGTRKPIRMVGSTSVVHDPSEAYFKRLFADSPNNPETWNNYGAWLTQTGRADEGIAAFKRSIELDPGHLIAIRNLESALAVRVIDSIPPD